MGFFFFSIAKVHELIGMGKCSEMDILLDLWVHTVFNDTQVQGSDIGPVVYFRNNTGNPLTSYSELAERWGCSRTTVSRLLKKLEGLDLLSLIPFSGNIGSVIYLKNYLSTMFSISDAMIDKEEAAQSPDREMIAAYWVLLDFKKALVYHTSGDSPVRIHFFSNDEAYEIIAASPEQEVLLNHVLAQAKDTEENRLVIVFSKVQAMKIQIPNVVAFCTVDFDGHVSYYQKKER